MSLVNSSLLSSRLIKSEIKLRSNTQSSRPGTIQADSIYVLEIPILPCCVLFLFDLAISCHCTSLCWDFINTSSMSVRDKVSFFINQKSNKCNGSNYIFISSCCFFFYRTCALKSGCCPSLLTFWSAYFILQNSNLKFANRKNLSKNDTNAFLESVMLFQVSHFVIQMPQAISFRVI